MSGKMATLMNEQRYRRSSSLTGTVRGDDGDDDDDDYYYDHHRRRCRHHQRRRTNSFNQLEWNPG
jgi:hypothetical protein